MGHGFQITSEFVGEFATEHLHQTPAFLLMFVSFFYLQCLTGSIHFHVNLKGFVT